MTTANVLQAMAKRFAAPPPSDGIASHGRGWLQLCPPLLQPSLEAAKGLGIVPSDAGQAPRIETWAVV